MLQQISCPIFFQNIVPKGRIPARREDFFAPRRSFCLPAAAEPGEFRIFVSKGPEGLHGCPGAGHQTKPTKPTTLTQVSTSQPLSQEVVVTNMTETRIITMV